MSFLVIKKHKDSANRSKKFIILFMFLITVKSRTEHTVSSVVCTLIFKAKTKQNKNCLILTPRSITMPSHTNENIVKTESYQTYKHQLS